MGHLPRLYRERLATCLGVSEVDSLLSTLNMFRTRHTALGKLPGHYQSNKVHFVRVNIDQNLGRKSKSVTLASVRRSEGAYHQASDNLALTESYGTPHKYPLGEAFSIDTSSMKFDLVLFTLGDCSKWVKMRFSEIHPHPSSWLPLARNVIEQYDTPGLGHVKMMPQNLNTMATDIYSFYNMADVQCTLLYTEDSSGRDRKLFEISTFSRIV